MPTKPEQDWLPVAAELIAREGLSFREAVTRLKIPLTTDQSTQIFRTKQFQRLLNAERNRYWRELALDPDWARKTAVGQLLYCAQQLITAGDFDKAAEVIMKASRVEGWLNSDTTVNVFAGLTARDLEEARIRIQAQLAAPANAN